MKYLSILAIFIMSTSAFAGDARPVDIEKYDSITGLYYKGVITAIEGKGRLSSTRSACTNLAIFDPVKETTTLLFKEQQNNGISFIIFEDGYKESSITFNGAHYSANYIQNNTHVAKREPKNKLLVGVNRYASDNYELMLFVSDKRGGQLKHLVTMPAFANWHIDVRNSKIRVVHQTGKGIRVESYDW